MSDVEKEEGAEGQEESPPEDPRISLKQDQINESLSLVQRTAGKSLDPNAHIKLFEFRW
jgi:hypothetical protein